MFHLKVAQRWVICDLTEEKKTFYTNRQ